MDAELERQRDATLERTLGEVKTLAGEARQYREALYFSDFNCQHLRAMVITQAAEIERLKQQLAERKEEPHG